MHTAARLALAPAALFALTAHADLFWEGGGATTDWNTTDVNWRTVSAGAVDSAWLAGDAAVLNELDAAIGLTEGITIDSLAALLNGTVTGAFGMDFGSGARTINAASGATLTLTNVQVAAVDSLNKTGDGTLVINGGNAIAISGATPTFTVSGGTLQFNSGGFGDGNGQFAQNTTINVESGGTIYQNVPHAFQGYAANNTINLNGGTMTLDRELYVGTLNMTAGTVNGTNEMRGRWWSFLDVTTNAAADPSTIASRINIGPNNRRAEFTVADGAAADDLVITGPIVGGNANSDVIKDGPGLLVINGGGNTFGGELIINEGPVALRGSGANRLRNNGIAIINDGTLILDGTNTTPTGTNAVDVTIGADGTLTTGNTNHNHVRNVTLNGGTWTTAAAGTGGSYNSENYQLNGDVTVGGTTASLITRDASRTNANAGVALVGLSTFLVNDATGDAATDLLVSTELEPADNNAGELIKSGLGTMTVDGVSLGYNGNTTVSAGTLALINGATIAGSTAVITIDAGATLDAATLALAAGQTLAGNGQVLGNVTANGSVAPGASVGTLTVTGDTTLAGSSDFEIDADADTSDLLVVTGDLTFGGTLVVTNLAGTIANGDTYDLFDFGTTTTSTFTTVTLPALGGGLSWDTDNLYATGEITVVPSPASALPLAVAGLALVARRRRNA